MNKIIDSKKNGFSYGWVIVIASFILLIGSFGTQQCFGVFLKPLSKEFGWTRAATAGAMSVVMGISSLFGIIMGKLSDKYNVRIIIAIGVVIGGLSYLCYPTWTLCGNYTCILAWAQASVWGAPIHR